MCDWEGKSHLLGFVYSLLFKWTRSLLSLRPSQKHGHSLRAPSRATAVGNGPAEATSRGRCICAFRHSLTCSTIVFFVLHASKPGILDQAAKEKFGKPRTTTPDVPLSGQSPLKHFLGLPWGLSGKESACQFRRHWFDP